MLSATFQAFKKFWVEKNTKFQGFLSKAQAWHSNESLKKSGGTANILIKRAPDLQCQKIEDPRHWPAQKTRRIHRVKVLLEMKIRRSYIVTWTYWTYSNFSPKVESSVKIKSVSRFVIPSPARLMRRRSADLLKKKRWADERIKCIRLQLATSAVQNTKCIKMSQSLYP